MPLRGRTSRFFRLAALLTVALAIGCNGATSKTKEAPYTTSSAGAKPKTKMEAFTPKAGAVWTIGYDEVGQLSERDNGYGSEISVEARELREKGDSSARGLTVRVRQSEYKNETALVDADEIPELLKGFDALIEVKSNPTGFRQFEVNYVTRGGLQLSTFNDSKSEISYMVRAGQITKAVAFLDEERMRALRDLVAAAQAKLLAVSTK